MKWLKYYICSVIFCFTLSFSSFAWSEINIGVKTWDVNEACYKVSGNATIIANVTNYRNVSHQNVALYFADKIDNSFRGAILHSSPDKYDLYLYNPDHVTIGGSFSFIGDDCSDSLVSGSMGSSNEFVSIPIASNPISFSSDIEIFDDIEELKDNLVNGEEKELSSSDNNGTYSKDLGTLQNISYKDIVLDDGKVQASNIQYHRFSFNQKSSTGIDIKDERYSIQYMLVSTLMRKRGILSKELTQAENYGERSKICSDDSNNLYIEYTHEEMFNLLPDTLSEYRSMNFLYKDKLSYDTYIRIYDNESKTFGTWVRVRVKGGEITDLLNGDLDTENTEVDFIDDEGNIISGGSTEKGFSASEGSGLINEGNITHGSGSINTGYSKEEALQNAENGKTFLIGFGDSKEYVQNVTSLFSEIISALGNVPKIIGDVFTFLPSWIVSFISFSIGVTLIIGLIKTLWS